MIPFRAEMVRASSWIYCLRFERSSDLCSFWIPVGRFQLVLDTCREISARFRNLSDRLAMPSKRSLESRVCVSYSRRLGIPGERDNRPDQWRVLESLPRKMSE